MYTGCVNPATDILRSSQVSMYINPGNGYLEALVLIQLPESPPNCGTLMVLRRDYPQNTGRWIFVPVYVPGSVQAGVPNSGTPIYGTEVLVVRTPWGWYDAFIVQYEEGNTDDVHGPLSVPSGSLMHLWIAQQPNTPDGQPDWEWTEGNAGLSTPNCRDISVQYSSDGQYMAIYAIDNVANEVTLLLISSLLISHHPYKS